MVFGWTQLLGNLGMTAIAGEKPASLSTNQTDAQIVLPAKFSNIKKAEEFSSQKLKWNSSEEVLSVLISFDKHESWFSKQVTSRPPNGSMFLFNKQKVKDYRKDGYTWKKRTSSSSYIREDHCKLKVYGVNCLNVLYTHSAIVPTFHRRIYWLLQNPDIVLVHYLNLIEEDLTEQVTFAREQKKSNISCQIKSIFTGVAEHLIPNFEITEGDETSSPTSAPGSLSQQKKSFNTKQLFKITISPSDPPSQTTATTTSTAATLSEFTNCAQSTYLWIRTNNGSPTFTHLPLQTNQPNLMSGHSNLGNRQCSDVSFIQGQSTPQSSSRTIQSAVLLTPVRNITRNGPVKTTGSATSNVSLNQENVRLPGSSSVTSTLSVPIGYQDTPLRSETQRTDQFYNVSESTNRDFHSDSGRTNVTTINTNTRLTYASPCGITSQPLLFFSSSSTPGTLRSASTINVSTTNESNPVDVNYSNGTTFMNNSTCVATSATCNAMVNNMCSFTGQREHDSSAPMDFQFRPFSLPVDGEGHLDQTHRRSFHNSGHVTISESNLKQASHDPTLSSHCIPISTAQDATGGGKSSDNYPNSSTNPHSVSAELSSSPSSDYGSLLSESGTRFSGCESLSSELGSGSTGHESAFDGPFRVPAPVISTHSTQNSSSFRINSVLSSSHDMHTSAHQSDDVTQFSRDTSTPLDSNHVDMSFELPELNGFELDYGTWSDDFSSVLGDYFNNSDSAGDNSMQVRHTITQLEQQIEHPEKDDQVPNENSSCNEEDDSFHEERIDSPGQVGQQSEQLTQNTPSSFNQSNTTETTALASTLGVSTSETCLTPVNDVVMTNHGSSQSSRLENVSYHSDATSFQTTGQPAPSPSVSVEDSRQTPISNHQVEASIPNAATVTAVTVMPASARISDFSPDWSYPEGGVKVLVTGEWSSYDVLYTCLFDGCSVEATLVQVGVLRCYCPPHEPGLVTLQVARNGFIVSNACVFEYRVHDTPGDLNTRHEWLTMDDGRFKLALLDRLERLESRLGPQAQNINTPQSNSGQEQCRTFEERVITTCKTLFQARFSNGSDLNRPYRGMTLLHLAAALGFDKLVREMATKWKDPETSELIRQEIDPSRKDEFSCTPLMWACALGHQAAVAELLCCHANALFVPDACGRVPLQVAGDRRYFDVVDSIEDYMRTSPESEDEEDASESYVASPSTVNAPSAHGTGQYHSPSLPLNSQPMSVENSYTDRACSPMHVEELSNGGVLLSQALVQIHEMINEAERQADLENSQLQGIATRVPIPLSPVQEESQLLTSPGGWGSSGGRLRSLSSASSQSSPMTPSSKSSLSPGSPGFLNSPHSSPGLPPDTKEFHEFLCSSKKLLEKNFSELTLTDREQQELYQAALIIQEAYRSYKIRRQQRDQEMQAALLIQNHYRKYKQFVLYKKMTNAALIIQNQYRAYREHEQFKKSRRAAAIIQNQFRIYRRRRQSQKRRDEHKSKQQEARFMRQSSNRSNTSH